MDLRDLWTGLLSVRRAAVLASQLKPGARVWNKLGTDAMWDQGDYLVASLIDATMQQTWVIANNGLKEQDRSRQPDPVPRPADARQARERSATMERKARLWKRMMAERQKIDGN